MSAEETVDADLDQVPFSGAPDPDFEVLSSRAIARAAAPTVGFRVKVSDGSGLTILTMALGVVITVEPSKRPYDSESRERLVELFGPPERWASTTTNFRWAQADAVVPAFSGGEAEFELVVPCTYDLELAAAKYFHGLGDGVAPLRFHFNGTVIYEAGDGRMQVVQIPWDRSPRFRMPIEVWRKTIADAYPFRSWVPVHADTLAKLERRKAEGAVPTFDAVIDELLERAEGEAE